VLQRFACPVDGAQQYLVEVAVAEEFSVLTQHSLDAAPDLLTDAFRDVGAQFTYTQS
jgi:hypothetical protein